MKNALNPKLIPKVVERLRALADATRIKILLCLREQPANVTTLSEALAVSQPSISKHLAILRRNGLVEAQRVGNQAVYSIRDEQVFEMCHLVCDGVARYLKEDHQELSIHMMEPRTPDGGRVKR